ncbi:hypothetical protein P3T73_12350 [Kiritimatiellota bacterium B12222]|nr:hypothetical protein P3T73_12350 [Kiritimatiellota bacterium B12222]
MLQKPHHFLIIAVLGAGLFSGCVSNSDKSVPMPPKPPEDRIQSKINPGKERTPLQETPAPPSVPAPKETPEPPVAVEEALPSGISLKLKGKEVTYSILETIDDPEKRTVTVVASPTTPFKVVTEVMDRVNSMGFMINFQAGD